MRSTREFDTHGKEVRMARQGKDSLKATKLTRGMLDAMERTAAPGTMRLIKALREAWRERDEAVGTLELERAEWQSKVEERAFQPRERVLIVVRYDGFVEAYYNGELDVKIVCEAVLDEEADLERKMPACYRDLYVPGYLRRTGMCAVKPVVTDLEILKVLDLEMRRELLAKLEAMERKP